MGDTRIPESTANEEHQGQAEEGNAQQEGSDRPIHDRIRVGFPDHAAAGHDDD